MGERSVFSPKAVFWLFAVGLACFAGALYLIIQGHHAGHARTHAPSAFSDSAIGHRAFAELLEELEVPVILSRHNSALKAGEDALLVLAEPLANPSWDQAVEYLGAASQILFVLPKWFGVPDLAQPRWVAKARPVPRKQVEAILRSIVLDGRLRRQSGTPSWTLSALSARADFSYTQLIASDQLKPIVAAEEGILLGELEYDGVRIWVLSDPDLISNHGLGRADNGQLAVEIVEALMPAGGVVIFDETIHGFLKVPSRLRTMFEFPFVVTTILALATLGVLAWAATVRFGAPLPSDSAVEAGKGGLIENTARLLEHAGHDQEMVRRYRREILREASRRLKLPRFRDDATQASRLIEIEARRGLSLRLARLKIEVDAATTARQADKRRLLRLAQQLYLWKEELLHGSRGHPKD